LNSEVCTKWREYSRAGIALGLSLFVLVEVNYPLLQPQSRLALFGLLGLASLFLSMPYRKHRAPGDVARFLDWILVGAVLFCYGYVLLQTEPHGARFWIGGINLGERAGQEVLLDIVVGCLGLGLVLEATRRAIGWTLPLLAVFFLLYGRFGASLPDGLFPHRGYTWARIVSQTFLHSQGVFGVALKVMFTYVFPFVIFGAFLEATGATGFIIQLSRRLFRNSAGGPAKVAVLSSGLMGSLSGSAVANTATTGTFTIPMMRSAGFSPSLAAGVEAAASSGGALMPPIMGAGAYMMLEIIDPPVTYIQIIKAALIPALLYYLTLLLVVHLYARKQGIRESGDNEGPVDKLSWAQGGLFVLAMATLIVFLILGFTPFRAVTLSLGSVLLVAPWSVSTRLDRRKVMAALSHAAHAGLPLIAAASCVGVILGIVTLTGIGSRLPATILPLAQDNQLAALFLLMISTIILGMGLPSAVCYLLMATLVGPVLTKLGLVPLAAHLFIFYFGMMSMVTPPVALAGYTAAAIAQADIMRTSLTAFRLALVGFLLPYAFVLNPSLLLLPDDRGRVLGPALLSLLFAVLGIVCLAAGTTGHWARRLSHANRAALFICAWLIIVAPMAGPLWLILKISSTMLGLGIIIWNTRTGMGQPLCIEGGVV
jgi:TRAP transporter 4TM/12TM fusion protein